MKKYVDKNRTERMFLVGDKVFLKLQPYIQASFAPWAHHKLLFKFYGPFPIIDKISDVAYELALPEGSTATQCSMSRCSIKLYSQVRR
jgi:hypothetical protein